MIINPQSTETEIQDFRLPPIYTDPPLMSVRILNGN